MKEIFHNVCFIKQTNLNKNYWGMGYCKLRTYYSMQNSKEHILLTNKGKEAKGDESNRPWL